MKKKTRARRNPSKAYVLRASRKGTHLYYNGKTFAAKGRAKVFATRARAKAKENELLGRFAVLENWAVYPVPFSPKL